MDKKLGIIVALDEECIILKSKINDPKLKNIAQMEFIEGSLNNKNIVLVKAGIGKVNAAVCAQILITVFGVSSILNSGVAGTLDPQIQQGDIVVSVDAVQHDVDTSAFGDPLG
ncbi:MAG: 5'-methylthioadenosine/S-adenosylhomocysteine nucleosidase, partial [Treponemataceae bacterium]